jgi:hypothetical protein
MIEMTSVVGATVKSELYIIGFATAFDFLASLFFSDLDSFLLSLFDSDLDSDLDELSSLLDELLDELSLELLDSELLELLELDELCEELDVPVDIPVDAAELAADDAALVAAEVAADVACAVAADAAAATACCTAFATVCVTATVACGQGKLMVKSLIHACSAPVVISFAVTILYCPLYTIVVLPFASGTVTTVTLPEQGSRNVWVRVWEYAQICTMSISISA